MHDGSLSPPGSGLPLRIEVDGGDGEVEAVLLGETARAEAVPRGRRADGLPSLLLEEHEDEPVDANVRPGALVAHHLPSCAITDIVLL